jgi:2-furoyl-CoA dehydrogenase FAD binding subunit
VKPAAFEYRRAETVEEAAALAEEGGFDTKVLAGGQSLVPLLNMRILRPSLVVDLNGIDGLDAIEAANGGVRIGALARQSAVEASPLVRERCPLLAECLPFVGHFVTRNRGTVGGSIAHADPGAELPLVLATLGGTVVTQRRSIAAEDFFVSHYTTALAPGELVVETVWPAAERGWGFAFEELAQRHGDYALAMAACAVQARTGEIRLFLGAVAERPIRVEAPSLDAVGEAAREAIDPVGNVHASAEYLRHVTGVLAQRAAHRAWSNAS